MSRTPPKQLRMAAALAAVAVITSCTGRGINAGEEGGHAFIAFSVMLLATLGLLWLAIGRGD